MHRQRCRISAGRSQSVLQAQRPWATTSKFCRA